MTWNSYHNWENVSPPFLWRWLTCQHPKRKLICSGCNVWFCLQCNIYFLIVALQFFCHNNNNNKRIFSLSLIIIGIKLFCCIYPRFNYVGGIIDICLMLLELWWQIYFRIYCFYNSIIFFQASCYGLWFIWCTCQRLSVY